MMAIPKCGTCRHIECWTQRIIEQGASGKYIQHTISLTVFATALREYPIHYVRQSFSYQECPMSGSVMQ